MNEDERKIEQEENKESMDSTLTSNMSDQGFWKEMWHQVRLAWFLLRSPDVPWYLKILPALAVVYVLIPTDIVPDFLPVIGQLDDVTALIVGAKVFIELSPQDVVDRHLRSMRRRAPVDEVEANDSDQNMESLDDSIVIEGDFQVVEDTKEDRAD